MEMLPAVAEGMKRMPKVVFSRNLDKTRAFGNGNVVLFYEPLV